MSKKLIIVLLSLLAIIPFALAATPTLYNCGADPLSPNTPTQCFANTVAYNDDTTWCNGATGTALANNDAAAVGANCDSIPNAHGKTACDRQETDTPYCKDGKGVLVLDMGQGQEIVNNHNDWDLIVGEGGASEPYTVSVSTDGNKWINLGTQCGSAQVNIPNDYANQKFRYIQFTADGKQKTCDGLTTVPPVNYGADIDFVMARTIPCSGSLCTPLPAEKPACSATFSPSSVEQGEIVTLTLVTDNARSVKANCATVAGAQADIDDGFTFVEDYTALVSDTCTFTVYSKTNYAGDATTCQAGFTVTTPPPTNAPTCDFAFHPNTITLGDEASFTLNTQNTQSFKVVCATPDGAQTFTNAFATTPNGFVYTDSYDVKNSQSCHIVIYSQPNYAGKSATCDGSITVKPVSEEPTPTCDASFNPDYILTGDSTTLTVTTANAKSIKVNCNEFESETPNFPVGSSQEYQYSPEHSDECYITVYAKKNYEGKSAMCEADVDVMPQPTVPSCSMSYAPDHISAGQTSIFSMDTSNARSYQLDCVDDIGQTYTDHAPTITEGFSFSGVATPTHTESCTLKVFSNEHYAGNYGSCTTRVTVDQTPVDHVHLSVPDKTLHKGDTVTFDLYRDYTTTNLAENKLTYTITGQSQPGIVTCALNAENVLSCNGLAAGQSTINLRVTNGIIKDTDTFVITVVDDSAALIDLSVPDQTIEKGESISLNLPDFTTYTGHEVHLAFELISIDDSDILTCSVSHQTSLHCLGNKAGQTSVHLRVSDGLISDTDTLVVTVLDNHQVMVHLSVPDQTIEEENSIDLDLRDFTSYTEDKDDLTYELVGIDDPTIITCTLTPQSDLHCTGNDAGQTSVHLRVTDGTVSDTDQFVITVTPRSSSTIATFTQGSICQGSATSLSVYVRDPHHDVKTITWDFGDGSRSATGDTVSHTYSAIGTYPVTITLSGKHGVITVLHEDVTVTRCATVIHELDITSSFIDAAGSTSGIASAGDTIDVYVLVNNKGNQNEDVHLSASLPELDIEENAPAFTLKPREGKWRIITITLSDEMNAGVYVIDLAAHADKTDEVGYVTLRVV